MARLASERENRVFSMATTITTGACVMYGPVVTTWAISPIVALSWTTMKCHGWPFMALAVRRPASTILCRTSSGIGSGLYCRTARIVRTVSKASTPRSLAEAPGHGLRPPHGPQDVAAADQREVLLRVPAPEKLREQVRVAG